MCIVQRFTFAGIAPAAVVIDVSIELQSWLPAILSTLVTVQLVLMAQKGKVPNKDVGNSVLCEVMLAQVSGCVGCLPENCRRRRSCI